jgi:hypothetical protein
LKCVLVKERNENVMKEMKVEGNKIKQKESKEITREEIK